MILSILIINVGSFYTHTFACCFGFAFAFESIKMASKQYEYKFAVSMIHSRTQWLNATSKRFPPFHGFFFLCYCRRDLTMVSKYTVEQIERKQKRLKEISTFILLLFCFSPLIVLFYMCQSSGGHRSLALHYWNRMKKENIIFCEYVCRFRRICVQNSYSFHFPPLFLLGLLHKRAAGKF